MVHKQQHNEHSNYDPAAILTYMYTAVGIIPFLIGGLVALIFSTKLVAVIMGIELLNLISRYIYGYHTAVYCVVFFALFALGVLYSTAIMGIIALTPIIQM